jgi:hypothetical protein
LVQSLFALTNHPIPHPTPRSELHFTKTMANTNDNHEPPVTPPKATGDEQSNTAPPPAPRHDNHGV